MFPHFVKSCGVDLIDLIVSAHIFDIIAASSGVETKRVKSDFSHTSTYTYSLNSADFMLRACGCARVLSKVPLLLYCLYDGILGSNKTCSQFSGSVTRGRGHSTQGLIFGLALLASMHGFQCRLLAN